ncbi:hypothetical protein M3Y94_00437300 [Aphelenchoides besseyi]|nr:hypothetical protein M3Y94_00437300 [Aphelenchoides besseyi]KAI6229430.1 hypothetical protein M3Y95_00530200 [Aphelenchoides besseyi]
MAEKQVEEAKMTRDLDDDDVCSEFSVISMHDENESLNGDGMVESHVYVVPSEVCESEIPDSISVNSHPAITMSPMMNSFASEESPVELEVPAPWSPDTLSGYVSTSSVAEMTNKLYLEYKLSHDMLLAINNALSEMKNTKSDGKEDKSAEELSKLREQLADVQKELDDTKAAQAKAEQELIKTRDELKAMELQNVELHQKKFDMEVQLKSVEDAGSRAEVLQSQLTEQCRLNKHIREQWDETQDELESLRRDLNNHKEITEVLQLNDRDSAMRMQHMQSDYQNQIASMEMMLASYYERNEAEANFATPTNMMESTHSWVNTSSNSTPVQMIPTPPTRVDNRRVLIPTTNTASQYQVFFCDCLNAFPSRGTLITHRASCSSVNDGQ